MAIAARHSSVVKWKYKNKSMSRYRLDAIINYIEYISFNCILRYKVVSCEDPFDNIIDIYTHGYEYIWRSEGYQ